MKRKKICKMISYFILLVYIIPCAWTVNVINSQAGKIPAGIILSMATDGEELSLDKASDASGKTSAKGQDTLYAIASVSKMYVTVAAMQLADQGLIDIDKPVVTYIPDFEMADARYKDITVRMLMDHTSGLMGSTIEDATLYEDDDQTAKDRFLERLKGQRLKADPGAFSTYCNDGFDLLEILVERVSGEDFTDYMTEHIVKPLGGTQTGSYRNAFRNPFQVAVYDRNNRPFAHEYHIGIGAGGVLSTTPELCKFGSTFFEGDTTLLSEESKRRMAENESSDRYEGNYALGWDDVDIYAEHGVKVVGKGGDLYSQHAELLVAPEEKISVAVCSSGGNSTVDELFAESLLNIALSERGIDIGGEEKTEIATVDTVPEEYRQYEGLYAAGQGIMEISFPDRKYMKTEIRDTDERSTTYYKYTGNGQFVRMLGGASYDVPGKISNDATEDDASVDDELNKIDMQDSETALYAFEKRANGKIYLVSEETAEYARLGTVKSMSYSVEKLDENLISENAKDAWNKRSGKYYYISGKYSSCLYDSPAVEVKMSEAADGYVYGFGLHAITDEEHARAFVNIPGHMGRDLSDMKAVTIDGKDCIVMDGAGSVYMKEEHMAEFTENLTEVTFSEREAKWFTIGENMGGALVSFDKTEQASVYVYDKSDQCTYSTYMSGFDNRIPLPAVGRIVFVGEPGEKVTITRVE